MALLSALTGQLVVQPVITDWEAFTPTGSWTTNTTYSGRRKQVTTDLLMKVKISLAGAPNATTLTLDLPPGLTLDATSIIAAGMNVGTFRARDGGTNTWVGIVELNAASGTTAVFYLSPQGGGATGAVTATVPFTFGSSDTIECDIRVPITEFGIGYVAYGAGLATATTPGLVNPYVESSGVVYSGRWTPTLTNGVNIGSSTTASGHYTRVGKTVSGSIFFTANSTAGAGTVSRIDLSLPIASAFTTINDLSGSGVKAENAGTSYSGCRVEADTTNDRMAVVFNAAGSGTSQIHINFSYEIK